jgi:hypothetical protein
VTASIVFKDHRDRARAGVRAGLQDGLGGHRVETADGALSIRPNASLAQDQKPGQPGDAAASGWTLVTERTIRRKKRAAALLLPPRGLARSRTRGQRTATGPMPVCARPGVRGAPAAGGHHR